MMSNGVELSDEWEVVARHGNYSYAWIALLFGGAPEPDSVTLTIRHKSTGATRTVTAYREREAITKTNNGQFDGAPASLRDARQEEAGRAPKQQTLAPPPAPRLPNPRLPLRMSGEG